MIRLFLIVACGCGLGGGECCKWFGGRIMRWIVAIGGLLGIFPCSLILGGGILGVVLPRSPGLPLGTEKLFRVISVTLWILVLPPRRSLKSWHIRGVVRWLMILLKWLSVISSLR